ncbi:MAG: DUF1801 domain-containing protein [Bacteroidia bacterium]|jgi:hypothetical protein|nr:DUF1801 domain-containing protein [Bacteroidia bacterium]
MRSEALSPDEYFDMLPEERKSAMLELRKEIKKRIPKGFTEIMAYGMPGYVVPHGLYPSGYHCNPKQALPFMGIASQKNFIAVYHMGLYADEQLLNWFVSEFQKTTKRKPDMGKSCLRFKKPDQIPLKLIGELASKMSVKEWVSLYEKKLKR